MILEFVLTTQHLYGKKSTTYNVHQLSHLVKSVHLWGPLWTPEDLYGDLHAPIRHFHLNQEMATLTRV